MHFPALLQALRDSSASLAPIVVAGLWQGLALAAALALSLRIAPRLTAGHRFALWAAGFVALVTLPFLPLVSRATASASVVAAPAALAPPSTAWFHLSFNWSLALAALWTIASLARAIDLGIHSLHLRSLWRNATPLATSDPRLAGLPVLEGPRAPQLCTTTQLDRPSVIGFFAPRILIPHWLLDRLTPGELRQIILHESEHLRRRDDWTNLLQKLCLVLFPLNPALWFMERRLCREREMACDEGVVRITRAPRAYAACLASLAERGLRRRTEALSLGAWQRRSELARRVHSLLLRNRTLSPLATGALLGLLGCGLLAGSVELARAPQLVAFVATQPAVANSRPIAAALPVPAPNSAATVAELHPLPNPARHTTRAPRPRSTGATQTSAALLAALQTWSNPISGSSTKPVAASSASAPQLVAANAPAPRPSLNSSGPQAPAPQEWIIFTAWQQVQTEPLRTSAPPANPQASADQGDQVLDAGPAHRITTQFVVTRVLLRVVPVSSAPANAAAIPVRGGWLVLQL
ncbi:MAG TPA: M56 family metallopeptidase [Terracidiphilus sp.]|nr:M56 family metallopeptidase [Terracidiphilus sp.]